MKHGPQPAVREAAHGVDAAAIRECLLRLAAGRSEGATYCPSEAARQLSREWRPPMQRVREVAAELVDEGLLVCTQKGVVADPVAAKGPIRLARRAKA
ncbi:DUF3253 domain-containing protein [Prosthecobacter sp.]|uniref:DUF3253 domain-containing protein n=1 Tax=Prosthecobacter sp. TaxID=1965333 RepID=UPI00378469F1